MSDNTVSVSIKGRVKKAGEYTASVNDTLLDVIFREAGGMPDSRYRMKAVLQGGTLGGFAGEAGLKRPVAKPEQIMVFDEGSCMVNVTRVILAYNHRCLSHYTGCPSCRAALASAVELLGNLTSAAGSPADLQQLIRLAGTVNAGCQDGCSALGPLKTALTLYEAEFQAHAGGRCPASICGELVQSPCSNSCPANVDLPGTIAFMQMGKFAEALALGRHDNPFFLTCGFVCEDPPCQKNCKRLAFDEAIYSQALHRFAGDNAAKMAGSMAKALRHPAIKPGVATGKKIAIAGAGPAGLSAAYFLARLGHQAVVYEQALIAGGMAAAGIPAYRIDRKVLAAEIDAIQALGVEIKLGWSLGSDISLQQACAEYDAVLLALGAGSSRKLNIPGEELANVRGAVDYLTEAAFSGMAATGEHVAVIGGGNVAVDAARTAIRLGARQVTLICVEEYGEMPASQHEIAAAEAEGVHIIGLSVPLAFEGSPQATTVVYAPVEPGPYDTVGRRWPPAPRHRLRQEIIADTVIVAIGQAPEIPGDMEGLRRGGYIAAKDYAAGLPGVFTAGDCAGPVNTVVKAVKAGKEAAFAIDQFLMHEKRTIPFSLRAQLGCFQGECICYGTPRAGMPEQSAQTRIHNFALVELGLAKEQANYEMLRCICAAKGGMEG